MCVHVRHFKICSLSNSSVCVVVRCASPLNRCCVLCARMYAFRSRAPLICTWMSANAACTLSNTSLSQNFFSRSFVANVHKSNTFSRLMHFLHTLFFRAKSFFLLLVNGRSTVSRVLTLILGGMACLALIRAAVQCPCLHTSVSHETHTSSRMRHCF